MQLHLVHPGSSSLGPVDLRIGGVSGRRRDGLISGDFVVEVTSCSCPKTFNIQVVHVLSGEQVGILIAAEGDHLLHKVFGEELS